MNKAQTLMLSVLTTTALLLASCASTRVTSDWVDQTYSNKPLKIVVMAMSSESADRRLIEDEFVTELSRSGLNAVASYTVLPEAKPANQEAVTAKVKELGADTLLMTRLVDRKTEREYVPGTAWNPPLGYHDWHTYYNRFYPPGFYPGPFAGYYGAHPGGYSPGYVTERVYGIREANLYDTATGKLVWSALSRTELRGNDKKEIRSYVDEVVKSLKKNDFVPG